jgi:hypothetical protein
METLQRFACVAMLTGLLPLAAAGTASASQLLARNATGVRIAVNASGQALVTYRAQARTWHVLVWNAINARAPSAVTPQVRFRIDRSGGWKTYGKTIWKTFRNVCRPYSGPALPFAVTACTAPDGSHWALQSWQRLYPNLGFLPWLPHQSAYELHVSHWSGELAELSVYTDWVYSRRFEQVFGRLTYQGQPVYGFKTNRYGARLDKYGRLIYLDTYDSPAYGSGWRRENSFVTHNPTGMFCYGFYQFDPGKGGYEKPASWPAGQMRGPGTGVRYRITTEGPGVTPDISTEIGGLHPYDPRNSADVSYERQMNGILDSLAAGIDKQCKVH